MVAADEELLWLFLPYKHGARYRKAEMARGMEGWGWGEGPDTLTRWRRDGVAHKRGERARATSLWRLPGRRDRDGAQSALFSPACSEPATLSFPSLVRIAGMTREERAAIGRASCQSAHANRPECLDFFKVQNDVRGQLLPWRNREVGGGPQGVLVKTEDRGSRPPPL